MNERTALLPAFAPADRLAALDLLDPVAETPRWHSARTREARLEAFRLCVAHEDRRAEMVRRAAVPKTGTGVVSGSERGAR